MANSKPRIMVVDDSQGMRASAKAALNDRCELMLCEDGLDAIAAMASFRPELVFVDITMPRLDGYETVALIRMNAAFRKTPVLMMSGKGGVFDLAKGRLLGFDGAIVKPFQPHQLHAAIEEHLGVALEPGT